LRIPIGVDRSSQEGVAPNEPSQAGTRMTMDALFGIDAQAH
jgi:hypothetical protein